MKDIFTNFNFLTIINIKGDWGLGPSHAYNKEFE